MWVEAKTKKQLEYLTSLMINYGCNRLMGWTVEGISFDIARKDTCKYYYYDTPKIKLVKGYKLVEKERVQILAYAINAAKEDYEEAMTLQAEHTKWFVLNKTNVKKVFFYLDQNEFKEARKSLKEISVVNIYKYWNKIHNKIAKNHTFTKDYIEMTF